MITYYTKKDKFVVGKSGVTVFLNTLHRIDGPAVIYRPGDKTWSNGATAYYLKRSKVNNRNKKICKEWYVNGKRHRLDGPAVEFVSTINTYVEWWINNKFIEECEIKTWIKNNNIDLKTKQHQVLFMLKFG